MAEGKGEPWVLTVRPAGTAAEATAAAERARKLLAGWLLEARQAGAERQSCP